MDHNKLWKFLQGMEIPDHLTCLLRIWRSKELNMEQWTGSKLGKEYIKAAYNNPAYLTSIQSTS